MQWAEPGPRYLPGRCSLVRDSSHCKPPSKRSMITPYHPSQPCFFGSEGTDINKETELLRTWIYKKWSDSRNQKMMKRWAQNKKIRARLLPCCVTSSHDLSPFFTKTTATWWPPERQTPSHLAWRLLTYGVYKWRITAVCPYSSHPFNVFFLFFDKKTQILMKYCMICFLGRFFLSTLK